MVTFQSLLLTAVVLLALGLTLRACLFWHDNKTKVNAAIWKVLTFMGRCVAAAVLVPLFFLYALYIILHGALLLFVRLLGGHPTYTMEVSVRFER